MQARLLRQKIQYRGTETGIRVHRENQPGVKVFADFLADNECVRNESIAFERLEIEACTDRDAWRGQDDFGV